MTIAKFDLDSTLVNSEELIELALAESGFMLDPNKRDKFKFEFIKGYEPPPNFHWEVFFYRLFTERLDELKPVDNYVNMFLEAIYDGKHPIQIITARPNGAIMHFSCMRTLERCFPNVEFSVDIVKAGSDKIDYMDGASVMFEDRRLTAQQLSAAGITCFVPKKEYNSLYGLNVYDIQEIYGCEAIPTGSIIRYDSFAKILARRVDLFVIPAEDFSQYTL